MLAVQFMVLGKQSLALESLIQESSSLFLWWQIFKINNTCKVYCFLVHKSTHLKLDNFGCQGLLACLHYEMTIAWIDCPERQNRGTKAKSFLESATN